MSETNDDMVHAVDCYATRKGICEAQYSYMITIKGVGNKYSYTTKQQLDYKLHKIIGGAKIIDCVYELDYHKRLHLHAVVDMPDRIKIKGTRSWHIRSEELKTYSDKERALSYLRKEIYSNVEQQYVFQENWINAFNKSNQIDDHDLMTQGKDKFFYPILL